MLLIAGVTCALLTTSIYNSELIWQREMLYGTAVSRAEYVEQLAATVRGSHPAMPADELSAAVLNEAQAGLQNSPCLGATGEVLVGTVQDGGVKILASSLGPAGEASLAGVDYSKAAQPLHQALDGKSGTTIGLDYRGVQVLAAYVPLRSLGWGVVAKIDTAEIRAPFIRAIEICCIAVALIMVLAAAWFAWATNPLVRKLAASRQSYRALVESTAAIPWEFDLQADRWTFVAPQVEQLLGYASAEWLDMQWWLDRVHPEDQAWVQRNCTQQAASGKFHSFEYRFITKDGRVVWIHEEADVEMGAHGPAMLRGVLLDVTERKLAQQQLATLNYELNSANEELITTNEELSDTNGELIATNEQLRATSEELTASYDELAKSEDHARTARMRLETILAAVPDIIMEVDNNKVYIWANRAGLEFFGDDAIGHEAAVYFEGEQATLDIVQPLFEGDEDTLYVESWQRRKDGEKRLLAWWCRVLKDANGEVVGALSAARDITAGKRAEDTLRRSEAFLDNVLAHSPHSLWVSDEQGTLLQLNQACRELLHVSDAEVVGKYNIFQDEILERQGFMPLIRAVFERGETAKFTLEYDTSELHQLALQQRSSAMLDVTISAIQGDDGRVTNAIIQHVDLTERKCAEQALQRQIRLQELLVKMSALYLNLPLDSIEAAIDTSLGEMAELVEADRAYIFDYDFARQVAIETYEWCRAGIASANAGHNVIPLADVLNVEAHRRGEGVWIPDVLSLPPGAFRDLLVLRGVKSQVSVPRMSEDQCIGFPGFTWSEKHHALSGDEQRLLKVFTNMLVNISQRKQAEEALRQSEERYRALVESSQEPIGILQDFHLVYGNPAMLRLLGYSDYEELIPLKVVDVVVPEDHYAVRDTYEGLIARREVAGALEIRLKRKDGTQAWVEVLSEHRDWAGLPAVQVS